MEEFVRSLNLERFRDSVTDEELRNQIKALHLSVWEWSKLASTAFLISLAMTSAMAAVFWFVS